MKLDFIKLSEAAAFSGHRSLQQQSEEELREKVRKQIKSLYAKGVYAFFNGMALGFDMLAAEELISLKKELPYLIFVAVVPFRGQSDRWQVESRDRWATILKKADQVIFVSDSYFDRCFLKRNDFMIDRVGHLICYYDGKPFGGTAYTYRKAKTKKRLITNLY